ncbi:hypothetical protein [Pontibacter flavimaris]|uniref:Uncharacterized protein n=1 Tax=Pontibacter flavimaris TaxID=1797110 RepID=A0A1Q5PG24_9BACT|nr:hypothetical protein [Pontibacter flavimaris]OKL41174.1 hypothetical protein A3841_15240 [Pontibacter flavimaris]
MKAGIASLLIGLAGLAILTYVYFQTMQGYSEAGELQQQATFYTMSDSTRLTLFILEVVGAALGFLSFRKWKVKIGLLGMGLCMLNLILLYYPF